MASYPTLTNTTLHPQVIDELENLHAQLEGYLGVEHNGDGTHKAITADSLSADRVTTGTYNADLTQPAQMTADQNDYDPQGTGTIVDGIIALDTNAARNITGLVAPAVTGTRVLLWNTSAFNITLKAGSASSKSENQFRLRGIVDYVLPTFGMVELIYLSSRWNGPVGA